MPAVKSLLHKLITRIARLPGALWRVFAYAYRRVKRWGGLKLKLITAISSVVLLSVVTLSHYLTDLMEESITDKAFEAGNMAIGRVADASFNAIVERTYENRINLMEMLKEAREDTDSNLLDISVYALERDGGSYVFSYFAGFAGSRGALQDESLTRWLLASNSKNTLRDVALLPTEHGDAPAYRFVRPVIFTAQNRNLVVGAVVLYYDREAISRPIRQAVGISTLATLLIMIPAIALAWWLAGRLSRPILQVSEAARRVADNDLDIQLNIHTADEIEFLSREFNRMVKGLREHQSMQKFVSGSTMNQVRAESANLASGTGKRVQTLLFSDIRGFTAMSEKRSPAEVLQVVNVYLDLQAQVIRRHGGDIDKFIGDEIMATFEHDDENKALICALQAAVEIQQVIKAHNESRSGQGLLTVEAGIGINRGEVVVGNMGSADRMDFTSVGAPVNLASRLCSHAEGGEILLPKSLYEESGAGFGVAPAESLTVKGFTQPVQVVSLRCS